MIYTPHQARVYSLSGGVYVDTTVTVAGHLANRDTQVQNTDQGFDFVETGVWGFGFDDAGYISMGDRLLVDGDWWVVTSPIQTQDAVYLLRHSRCTVEKVVEE